MVTKVLCSLFSVSLLFLLLSGCNSVTNRNIWEYKVISRGELHAQVTEIVEKDSALTLSEEARLGAVGYNRVFDRLGKDGWEYVEMDDLNQYIFKRRAE